jgi:hypothetical protein
VLGASTLTPGLTQTRVAMMFAMKPSAIRAKVVTLAGRRSNFWDLGNALLMLRDTSRYTGDFKRTVKNAGLNLRQAYYLCEIVDQLRPFTRYKERFEAIGWTKTQVIARALNKQNLKERLEWAEAKRSSTRKLQSLMKAIEPPFCTTARFKHPVLFFGKIQHDPSCVGRRGLSLPSEEPSRQRAGSDGVD